MGGWLKVHAGKQTDWQKDRWASRWCAFWGTEKDNESAEHQWAIYSQEDRRSSKAGDKCI